MLNLYPGAHSIFEFGDRIFGDVELLVDFQEDMAPQQCGWMED